MFQISYDNIRLKEDHLFRNDNNDIIQNPDDISDLFGYYLGDMSIFDGTRGSKIEEIGIGWAIVAIYSVAFDIVFVGMKDTYNDVLFESGPPQIDIKYESKSEEISLTFTGISGGKKIFRTSINTFTRDAFRNYLFLAKLVKDEFGMIDGFHEIFLHLPVPDFLFEKLID